MIWALVVVGFGILGTIHFSQVFFLEILALFPLVYLGLHRFPRTRNFSQGGLAEADLLIFAVGMFLLR